MENPINYWYQKYLSLKAEIDKMKAEAVEGIVHPYDSKIWVNLIGYGYKFNDGDKVRIIIVKEDGK